MPGGTDGGAPISEKGGRGCRRGDRESPHRPPSVGRAGMPTGPASPPSLWRGLGIHFPGPLRLLLLQHYLLAEGDPSITLTLIYIVKVMTQNNIPKILAVGRCSLKSY